MYKVGDYPTHRNISNFYYGTKHLAASKHLVPIYIYIRLSDNYTSSYDDLSALQSFMYAYQITVMFCEKYLPTNYYIMKSDLCITKLN